MLGLLGGLLSPITEKFGNAKFPFYIASYILSAEKIRRAFSCPFICTSVDDTEVDLPVFYQMLSRIDVRKVFLSGLFRGFCS